MINKKQITLLFLLHFFLWGCMAEKMSEIQKITIHRFDNDLYDYLSGNKTQEDLAEKHQGFLDLFGERIIGIGRSDSEDFFPSLRQYFSHPELLQLYQDETELFSDISSVEESLSTGFHFLTSTFDSLEIPQIYMHTSGLNQNIIISEQYLSISADKYLGEQYPMYNKYFYDYQRRNMIQERLACDYLLGFLMSTFPIAATNNGMPTLLDEIIYQGKLLYLITLAMPADAVFMCYNQEEEDWFQENEADVWTFIVQEKHLFSQNRMVISKYIQEAPYSSFFSEQSPSKIGVRVGLQIVRSYMKNNKRASLPELMRPTEDGQSFLQKSKYRPNR